MAKPNIKALAINHGEKFAFGLFGLIVLCVLATTSWSRYAKTPDDLKRKVLNARNKISAPENIWPQAEQDAYKVVDFSERSRLLFMPLATIAMGRFDFSTPLYHPLYRKDEPRREPVFEPVQYLITVSGTVPLSMAATPESDLPKEETKSTTEPEMSTPTPEDEAFTERPAAQANAGPIGRGSSTAMSLPAMMSRGMAGPSNSAKPQSSHGSSKNGAPPTGAGRTPGIFSEMPGAGSSADLAALGSDVKARGVRYIAVRGVFPLAKQIDNYKKALHVPQAEATNLFEIADFVLERQVATSNRQDPWKDAKWEQVNLATAVEILKECSELDPLDPVPTAVKDSVITMDLPARLLFTWGPAATHPKIKNLDMKPEEIALEGKLLEAADQAASDSNLQEPVKPRQRGLTGVQRDVKSMVKSVASNPDSMAMMKAMAGKMAMPGAGSAATNRGGPGSPMLMPGAQMTGSMPGMNSMPGMMGAGMMGRMPGAAGSFERLVVNTQYLLFRYLDFDVEPGLAYRYRVRLQLRNPNFDLSPEELGSAEPEIAKGDERETPWSNISNPEVVPTTLNFYLKQVEREPYEEEKIKPNSSRAVAKLSMFDWDTKLGTVINEALNIWSIGAFIGDEKKREVVKLDLVNQVLDKDTDFKFASMNVLLDVDSDLEVEANQHPDLKLAAVDKRGNARVGLVPEALVAMESGEVEILDPYSERDEEHRWVRQRDAERRGFELGKPKTATNRLDALAAKDADNDDDKAGGKKKKKKKDPRRKTGSTADALQQSQTEMMRRMMSGPAAAPAPTTKTKGKK